MTFTIPPWLLWTLGLLVGVPAILAIVMFAILGVVLTIGLGRGGFWR